MLMANPILNANEIAKIESSSVTKVGAEYQIKFKLSKFSDVAIYIEDTTGNIVRHLAAGVLGSNAPLPFTKDSLEQIIIWDGQANYKKEAGAGPFKVRIAVGMNAQFEKIIMDGGENNGGVRAMATTKDGTLVMASAFGADVANWSGWTMQAYDQNGDYQKTLFPPPNYFSKKDFEDLGIASTVVDGKDVPVYSGIMTRSYFAETPGRRTSMIITSKDEILMLFKNGSISAIHLNGKAAMGGFRGPRIFNLDEKRSKNSFMALSSDEKSLFVSSCTLDPKKGGFAIYKVPLPSRDKAEVFFGEDTITGKDENHLGGDASGIAIDGKGNLLVSDTVNNRVLILSELTGKYTKEFPFQNPNAIVIDKKTEHIYITSNFKGDVVLFKLKSADDPVVLKKKNIPRNGAHDYPYVLALDTTGPNPVIWAGGDYGAILRLEDVGEQFNQKERQNVKVGHGAFVGLTVDRYSQEKEVFARLESGVFMKYNETTGNIGWLKTGTTINQGVTIDIGPNGDVYGAAYPFHLFKYDKTGKPSPWKTTARYPEPTNDSKGSRKETKGPAHGIYVPVSMTFMTHTVGIRPDGNIFVFQPKAPGDRPPKMLMEYTPDGDRINQDPIIWKVSDVAVGPKFDAQGNIYIAEHIKPIDQYFPEEFNDLVGEVKFNTKYDSYFNSPKGTILGMYGSIVKFSPKGGMIHWGGPNPYDGEPKLDDSLKTVEASYYEAQNVQRLHKTKITGADWIKLGVSHIELHYCNCESTRFDVDPFGRVYYPDLLRYQVRVIDTNANDIMHFGSYGNTDSKSNNSINVDEITGKVLKDKKGNSPYDKTKIPFSWLIGVGATDKYIYAGDSSNRRLTQVKINYNSEVILDIN